MDRRSPVCFPPGVGGCVASPRAMNCRTGWRVAISRPSLASCDSLARPMPRSTPTEPSGLAAISAHESALAPQSDSRNPLCRAVCGPEPKETAGRLDITFAADMRFVVPLQAAVASVAAHAPDKKSLRIWIATDREETRAGDIVRHIAASSSLDARWLPLDVSLIADAPVVRPWSRATYLRLMLAAALPPHIERFIYLDSDVVVERDLRALYASELGGRPLAAVGSFRGPPRRGPIDLTRHPYFNAGVMVIDRREWIARGITPRAIECIAAHPEGLQALDQDALNAVVAGDWAPVDRRWNQLPSAWELSHRKMGISREALRILRREPFIIHFAGLTKPWKFGDDHPLRGRFAHYSRLAGLSLPRPAPESVVDLLRRAAKVVVPRRGRPAVRDALRDAKRLMGIRW